MDVQLTLGVVTCPKCGVPFGMPEDLLTQLREQGGEFYCPNGHGQRFAQPLVKRLEKSLQEEQRRREQVEKWYKAEQADHEHTRNRLRATKGALTRTKRRVAHGVCPCCNRTFQDLAQHMASQHPDFPHEDPESE